MLVIRDHQPRLFLGILFAIVAASLYLRFQFNFNAGHMDEYDYLFVGKQLLSGESWPSHTYIFGSDFNWYVLGWGEQMFGGLAGARMIAACFGLLSLLGMYWLVYSLWQRHLTAIIATCLLALQPLQLFISRFATYDIISFALFTLALAPLYLACQQPERFQRRNLILSIILMSLAVMSKYVVILYMPLIAGLAFLGNRKAGFIFGAAVGSILLAYMAYHWDALKTVYEIQIVGVHGAGNSTPDFILGAVRTYLSFLSIAWMVAMFWVISQHKKGFWRERIVRQLGFLLILALPMAIYHFNALNMIALYKHLVYACFFLVPALAWLLTKLVDSADLSWMRQGLAAGIVILLCHGGYQQLKTIEVAYADVTPVINQTQKALTSEDTILSEDPYLFRYLGQSLIQQSQIKETGWLDNNLDGKHEHQDVIDAVWDKKFSYVFLNDQLHFELNKKLRGILKQRGYKSLIDIPYQLSDVMSRQTKGSLSLYQRVQAVPEWAEGID